MKIHHLFPTEIGIDHLGDTQLISDLIRDGMKTNSLANLWKVESESISKVKLILEQKANEYAKEIGFGGELESVKATLRVSKYGQYTGAHHHSANAFICSCLYLKTTGSGRFVMHDPRGSIMWHDIEAKNRTTPNNAYPTVSHGYPGSTTQYIEPKVGMIVFFPGWMVHSVEPNMNQQDRIALASDYRFKQVNGVNYGRTSYI